MKAIINFYSKKSNPLTIISAALAMTAFVLRIVLFGTQYQGAPGAQVFWLGWLPCIALALFALELIFSGEPCLYKTIIPVLLITLFGIIRGFLLGYGMIPLFLIAYISLTLAGGVLYAFVAGAKLKATWPLMIAFGASSACFTALLLYGVLFYREISIDTLSMVVISLSMLFAAFSMKPRYDDGSYVRRWGDRNDGRKVRSLSPIFKVSPYIMVNRNGSSNLIKDSIEITDIEKYIREKRANGLKNFGIMHVIIATYVRTIAQYPGINRFLGGQKVYSRDGHIEVNMNVKKEMTTSAPDTVIKVCFEPTDTAEDVYRKMNEKVEEAKNTPLDSGFDDLAKLINFIPGLFLKFTVHLLKTLDYFGRLPRQITSLSPFHGSLYITSMGSLGIPPIYHHLYDFGNVPVFCSFGCKRTARELDAYGNVVFRKYVDWTWVTDERICDGFYFATALKQMKRIIARPEKLDVPPETVVPDID